MNTSTANASRITKALIWAAILTPLALSADETQPQADAARMRSTVTFLASDEMAGRAGADAIRAGAWVAEQFSALNLEPLFDDEFVQTIVNGDGETIGTNIGAVVRGTDESLRDEYVFVTGHHDHLGTRNGKIFHGANDNASAVAMVLEAARWFTEQPAKRTVVFVSFDLEENMLWGSRYFTADPPFDLNKISLFITADMIGRPLGDLPLEDVFVMGGETAEPLAAMIASHSKKTQQPVMRLGADIVGTRSDYGPFRNEHVPFLFFSTGENPDYHTPEDTPDKINFERAARITNLVIAVANEVANAPEKLKWTGLPPSDLSDAKTLNRVCTVVQEVADAGRLKLGVVEKLLVTQTLERTQKIIDSGKLTPVDRKWLVRAAQGMLLTLF